MADPLWFIRYSAYAGSSDLFWSLVARPLTSHAWAFPLCVLVLYEELIPSFGSLKNQCGPSQISPLSLLSPTFKVLEINKPPQGLNRGFMVIR